MQSLVKQQGLAGDEMKLMLTNPLCKYRNRLLELEISAQCHPTSAQHMSEVVLGMARLVD